MLKCNLIGHLGSDATLNNVSGKNVINMNVAHSETWVGNDGVKKQKTIWVECAYLSERTAIAQYLKKGTQVYVEGGIEAKTYQTKGGQTESKLVCRVMSIQLLGSGNGSGGGNVAQPAAQSQPVNSDISEPDQDLPF